MKMSLDYKAKRRKESKNLRRFYTSLDMAIIKKDMAIRNSRIKRGEIEDHPNNIICVCGCGHEGCFLHVGFENR